MTPTSASPLPKPSATSSPSRSVQLICHNGDSVYEGLPTKTIPSSSSVSVPVPFSLLSLLASSASELGREELSEGELGSTTSLLGSKAASVVPLVDVDSGSIMAETVSAGDCVGGARESTLRSASLCECAGGSGMGAEVKEEVEEDGGGGALGSEISRRAATICSRTRIARSATSATVRPVVGMGGRTGAM